VLIGPSGCGKSTLLRLTGGLVRPQAGRILLGDVDLAGLDEARLREERRQIGMLFQSGALLDSLSILENIALPLREHTLGDDASIRQRVREVLDAVGLDAVEALLPGQLSGGMLRRAALARAIVMEPRVLLCDEPFSGLDPPNVERIEALLTRLNRELDLTLIVTSHHMASSLRMGDQLVLLQDGRALAAAPEELDTAGNESLQEFLGADGRLFAEHWASTAGEAAP